MTYEEYKNKVKKAFMKIKFNLKEAEVDEYFNEPEATEQLKEGYDNYKKGLLEAGCDPVAVAYCLHMMY